MSVRRVEVAKLNIPVVTESLIFTSIIGKIEDSAVTILSLLSWEKFID